MPKNKIKKLTELKSSVAADKRKGKKVVFTNGCFDILHLGHIKYLEQAAALGDKLIIAVNSDASVRKLKGLKRPIFPQKGRARLVAALECVDYVIIFNADTPLNLIKALKPDVLVKGGDWRSDNIVGKDFVESYGGKVKSCGFVKGYSTSSIIARIKAGQ
jgi:D-beta-D-heptose 7-phosphate kinase/D-beta-D-heptose 1-phosphate adenosyltransferase